MQSFVLQADVVTLFVVGRKSKAACAAKGIAGSSFELVESRFGALPQLLGRLGAVRFAGDVITGCPTAEREAPVASARALGDSARIVHPYAQAAARECECARNTGDAGADDRDIDVALRPRLDRARRLVEPEWRVHEADATRVGGRSRLLRPSSPEPSVSMSRGRRSR